MYKSLLIIILASLGLISCSGEGPLQIEEEIREESQKLPRLFLRTKINLLRIRETPDLQGTVLKIMSEGLITEYMHDSTRFTTKTNYLGKEFNSNWYKVQTQDEVEGWIYAAFAEFLNSEENQKELIFREAEELKEASTKKGPKLNKKEKKELSKPENEKLVGIYKAYLSSLSKNDPESVSKGISKFKTLIVGSNVRTCDAAYVEFDNFYQKVLLFAARRNLDNYQHLYTEVERYQRSSMLTDDYTKLLAKNGFNFSISEGRVVLAEDVDFLYRTFYRECSVTMRSWMNQYQNEEPNFWLDKGNLLVSPKKLSRWVLTWNYFITVNPGFVWHDRAKKRLKRQLSILLQGSSGTPVFEDKTYRLNERYLNAYKHIAENYPNSNIGKSFKEYLSILQADDMKSSTDATEFQNKIIKRFSF